MQRLAVSALLIVEGHYIVFDRMYRRDTPLAIHKTECELVSDTKTKDFHDVRTTMIGA
jgi:hypothetical protein